ncbi:MAG: hypothetical protein KY466_07210 [Gemmatimonadetes bacterium]|nr:hypothetical protein [Gemmatimonadota bacterium]
MAENDGGSEKQIPASTGESETTRASGMGAPGEFASLGERGRIEQARAAAGGKLEETARRVRELGDRTAAKNRALQRARPLANNAADNIDSAARYVRERELDEVRSDLEEQVRRHPLASVAMAFLAGYTLRRLF